MVNYIKKYWIIVASMMLVFITSCTKDYPKNVDSPDEVVLKSIKIVNAGAAGNTVVQGMIDEDKKTVSFPRLDVLTDFSKIRFEAEMSNGATLDQSSYAFDFGDGESVKAKVVKVVNNKRFREYMVTLRKLVPVFGADFSKAEIYDYTNNPLGNPIYPGFVSLNTRGTGFDGQRVLIVTRATGGSHLLDVSELKQNKVSPIKLNLTGVVGGTLDVNVGAQVKGHTYIANLSGGLTSPFRIYHWTDPSAAPQVIADLNIASIPGAGTRHGDNMSVNLDENGNGFMYFGDNAVSKILRLTVTNYTTISGPTVLPNASGSSYVMSFNRVGNTGDYIYTGYDAPIRVANESAVISYTLPTSAAVPNRGCDARVVTFNGERYLIMTTAARGAQDATVLYVYDITKGSTITEALQLFDAKVDKAAIFQYSLFGTVNTTPSTQTGWYVTKDAEGKDDKLTLYTASADAGFVIIDFPKKKMDD
ncbi:DUF4623 domain-containing protein [Flavisolibacter tropicus]|uniref:DUF4623 domain-containing protein n=1 Tax=Flavisolibacter tropicus TaxID=1492898 RepID=A0A172TY24_9BACT|nr:DUF4623 domain-containing protein [Flavisolibacter tropicus]ANE51868.1 hypothetical protein SY85_16585 [Flavisolibacter tropicus]